MLVIFVHFIFFIHRPPLVFCLIVPPVTDGTVVQRSHLVHRSPNFLSKEAGYCPSDFRGPGSGQCKLKIPRHHGPIVNFNGRNNAPWCQ